jgi:hypothetical protein
MTMSSFNAKNANRTQSALKRFTVFAVLCVLCVEIDSGNSSNLLSSRIRKDSFIDEKACDGYRA